ncbi:TetR/AcrR family transcriptional regulator [Vineibacter terrae]|uniref:TetR/AcrR family transcriptional regulator n=1 Tax=Vineibacter terrae TaxID=2586908 RepID=UPI002E3776DF|nr:TetR/AcrR family transcriptional regulator [Vineibacter terrae]HEX2886637.1 TetR/AcrR family transcriptional regulator [Vineibacter terrae]
MKVSKETSAKHRDALVRAASRLFREKGFDKVGIAEITAAAGLTHGAFYTHFASKEALCAEAITRTSRRTAEAVKANTDWRAYVEAYLDPKHVRDRGNGCPYAALSGDVPREGALVKSAFSEALEGSINALADRLGDKNSAKAREQAILSLATLVGAVVLARTATDTGLRDEILSAAKTKLLGPSKA